MNFNKPVLACTRILLAFCLICVSAMAFDAVADGKFQDGNKIADVIENQVFGRITAAVPTVADSNGEMPAGDLVADAQLMTTQSANLGGAQIALVNPSGLANNGLTGSHYPFDVSYNELYKLQPKGLNLITMSLTAQQLKYVLEQQFAGCGAQTQLKILQVSNGFNFSWKPDEGACSKIWAVKLTRVDMAHMPFDVSGATDVIVSGGVVLNPDKTYRVTVNDSLAKGGDNFTIFKDGLNLTEGVSDTDALASYLENFKFPKPSYDPNAESLNKPRIIKLPLP